MNKMMKASLTKQYLPITDSYNEIPIVIYPAKDDGQIDKVFNRKGLGNLQKYVNQIIMENIDYYSDSDIVLAYIWNQGSTPYCDIWKVNRNQLSDDSGFLYDARIYKNTDQVTDMGVASGNTLIVLTAEEILLRDLILKNGLSFSEAANREKYYAHFPAGYVPIESFYQ
jgi:hypothetical protein